MTDIFQQALAITEEAVRDQIMAEYLRLIEDCEQRESRLSEWDATFIDSLKDQITRGKAPSQKQIDALDAVWERATARG